MPGNYHEIIIGSFRTFGSLRKGGKIDEEKEEKTKIAATVVFLVPLWGDPEWGGEEMRIKPWALIGGALIIGGFILAKVFGSALPCGAVSVAAVVFGIVLLNTFVGQPEMRLNAPRERVKIQPPHRKGWFHHSHRRRHH